MHKWQQLHILLFITTIYISNSSPRRCVCVCVQWHNEHHLSLCVVTLFLLVSVSVKKRDFDVMLLANATLHLHFSRLFSALRLEKSQRRRRRRPRRRKTSTHSYWSMAAGALSKPLWDHNQIYSKESFHGMKRQETCVVSLLKTTSLTCDLFLTD